MKTFEQLTLDQQEKALEKCRVDLLTGICEGAIRFNDKLNRDNLQARIDAAMKKANKMQTPWFAAEYIMDTCAYEISSMARANAENALYPETGEHCIHGVAA